MKKRIFLGLICAVFSTSAWAEDKSAGCGLGQMVFPDKSLFSTTSAGIVDNIVPGGGITNSFATTTGTLGCGKHKLVKNEKLQIHYLEANYGPLKLEMAQGDGEYLQGFARMMGCNPAVQSDFNQFSQQSFFELYGQGDRSAVQVLKHYKKLLRANKSLSQNCLGMTS